jgi:hypothetical protein
MIEAPAGDETAKVWQRYLTGAGQAGDGDHILLSNTTSKKRRELFGEEVSPGRFRKIGISTTISALYPAQPVFGRRHLQDISVPKSSPYSPVCGSILMFLIASLS